MVDIALDAGDLLTSQGVLLPTVVNMRFAKPLDEALLLDLAADHSHFITIEEHALAGGFGSAVLEFAIDRALGVSIERLGVPGVLVAHDSQERQRALFGLTAANLAGRVRAAGALAPV
jgi:1-deoxy-D-xylulose-5-phosphate synthase